MVNIITIKNDTIPYLNQKIISTFENVTLISKEGFTIKINSLLLGAMSHSLKVAFFEAVDGDEYLIITEFGRQELIQMKQFCMTGSCNVMTQSLLQAFGLKVRPIGLLKTALPVNESTTNEILQDRENVDEISKNNLEFDANALSMKHANKIRNSPIKTSETNLNDVIIEHSDGKLTKLIPVEEMTSNAENENNLIFPDRKLQPDEVITSSSKNEVILKFPALSELNTTFLSRKQVLKPRMVDNDEFPCSQEKNIDKQISKITTPPTVFEACTQCGLTAQQASTTIQQFKNNYSLHYKQKNLLYATAIHSLSCGPGPLHNNECAQCYRKMSSFEAYQEHVKDDHDGKWVYRCGHCPIPELFDSKQDCLDHTSLVHGRKSRNKLKPKIIDNDQEEEVISFNCPYCEKGFRLEKQMNRHFSTEHPKEIKGPMTCEHCGKIYIGRTNLKAHQKSTHNEMACAECGKIVKVGKLLYHIQQYHTANENKKYKCPTCGRGFVNKQARDDHINVHTGEKPHKCKYCPATFASNGTLGMHQRAHLGIKRKPKPKSNAPEPDLPCEECGKIFRGRAKLKIHKQHHHVESQCAVCGIMVTNAKMKFHVKKNHKEK